MVKPMDDAVAFVLLARFLLLFFEHVFVCPHRACKPGKPTTPP